MIDDREVWRSPPEVQDRGQLLWVPCVPSALHLHLHTGTIPVHKYINNIQTTKVAEEAMTSESSSPAILHTTAFISVIFILCGSKKYKGNAIINTGWFNLASDDTAAHLTTTQHVCYLTSPLVLRSNIDGVGL